MSHLLDFVLAPDHKMDMDLDVDAILPEEMKNIFDNPELMSSDFFDSVFSMEKQNLASSTDMGQDLGSEITSDDCSSPMSQTVFTETTTDELFLQDDVQDNITLFGKENSETINGDNVLSVLEQNVQHSINEILGVTNNNSLNFMKPVANGTPKKLIVTQPMMRMYRKPKLPAANLAPGIFSEAKKGLQNIKKTQLLRIQSVQGNGKPLLLPVNVKNMKKFRVINASDLKVNNIKVLPPSCTQGLKHVDSSASSSESLDDDYNEHTYTTGKYPPLHLTAEEKRLLMKEGITLPTHYPLSKQDEKELKRIRRKIRNKISAQDSRKRKKEYVDQLEEKARRTDEENEILKKRVKILNRENTRLYEQLKKLQDVLFNTSNKATPTTCLMIVLFSTLLVCLPNLRTPGEKTDLDMVDQEAVAARRVLLFDPKVREEEELSLEEFLVLKKEENEVHFEDEDKENDTSSFVKYLGDLSKKYETLIRSNCTEILQGGSLQDFCKRHENDFKHALQNLRSFIDKGGSREEKKFIEPDISDDEEEILIRYHNAYLLDDDDPPTKKVRVSHEFGEYEDHTPIPIFEVEISPSNEPNSIPVKE